MFPPGSSVGTARPPQQVVSRGPFQPHGDPHLFYGGGGRAEALETLLGSIRAGAPVLHVHGERGSGRTFLSLVLAARLAERHRVLRLCGVPTAATLLRALLLELAPQHADLVAVDSEGRGLDRDALETARRALVSSLEARSVDARPIVLLIDGDGACDAATLELAASIAATRTGCVAPWPDGTIGIGAPDTVDGAAIAPQRRSRRRPAVQIVCFRRTAAPAGRAHAAGEGDGPGPRDSIPLRRLGLAEVGEYLHHHMLLFDYNRRDLFTREMTYFVADRSEGVFRAIDTIARNGFTIAGLQDADRPTLSHLLLAGLPPREEPESPGTSFLSRHRGMVVAMLGSSVLGLALTAVVFATR